MRDDGSMISSDMGQISMCKLNKQYLLVTSRRLHHRFDDKNKTYMDQFIPTTMSSTLVVLKLHAVTELGVHIAAKIEGKLGL